MGQIVISASNLTKTFLGKEVIWNCTFSVEQGSIYGFMGRNGAGKTTVLKLLLGLLKPSAGTAGVLGLDSVRDNEAILRHTGSLTKTPIFCEHLSAADNLRLHLAYMGIEDTDVEATLCRVSLPSTGNQPVSTFSLDMRQRLAIARAIIHRPEVLILDEPVNGLDPVGMKEMRILFCRLVQEEGMTILMSSHLLSEIDQIADRVGVIVDGTIVREAEMTDICKQHSSDVEDYFISLIQGGADHA
ncbi:ATP-binding cassette domain-containing protein [Pusillibacter faecalis]|uniref:ATP-binding cassette domain-containing protein n=1 Tax=Pusillibacter faecalis TaxID=2714358 RepID=UPI002943E340|nr:ATP-binding cassette domain-containing protein [Pusillibacter faecalis]